MKNWDFLTPFGSKGLFGESIKAPQKQCKSKKKHENHHFEDKNGLIWWCQGRKTSKNNYGYPETYGLKPNGHCGHCNGKPEHQATGSYGTFCLACFRWCVYTGPKQNWGDGMKVTR